MQNSEDLITNELNKYVKANRGTRRVLLEQLNQSISQLQTMQGTEIFTRKMGALGGYSMQETLDMQLELKSRIERLAK